VNAVDKIARSREREGKVVAVLGSVVEVEFPGDLPAINESLHLRADG
jgi:F0F1-type ATP synthase beta subunit